MDSSLSGTVIAICISKEKGIQKKPVQSALLCENHGIDGDGHAGDWHRQVSLLTEESINTMRVKGLDLNHGDFAENIVTKGIDLISLPVGARISIGDAIIEITQIGKECHTRCAIYYQAGDCVMPREGIFARVLKGGEVKPGTLIQIL